MAKLALRSSVQNELTQNLWTSTGLRSTDRIADVTTREQPYKRYSWSTTTLHCREIWNLYGTTRVGNSKHSWFRSKTSSVACARKQFSPSPLAYAYNVHGSRGLTGKRSDWHRIILWGYVTCLRVRGIHQIERLTFTSLFVGYLNVRSKAIFE